MKLTIAAIGVGIALIIIVLALTIATLVIITNKTAAIVGTTTMKNSLNSVLAESIRIEDVMNHLKEFQRIASDNGETRAVSTAGFNQTLNYITDTLALNTDYTVTKTFFPIRQFALASPPVLISSINGVQQTYTYSTDLSLAEFYHIQFSIAANFTNFVAFTAIPNVECSDDD